MVAGLNTWIAKKKIAAVTKASEYSASELAGICVVVFDADG